MERWTTHCTLLDSLLDLLNFGLAEALDVLKLFLGGLVDRLRERSSEYEGSKGFSEGIAHCNGVIAVVLELADVNGSNSCDKSAK